MAASRTDEAASILCIPRALIQRGFDYHQEEKIWYTSLGDYHYYQRIRNYYWLVRNSILYILYTPKDSAVIRPRFGEYVSIIFSHWVWMVFRISAVSQCLPKGKSYYTFTSNYTRNLDFRLLDLMKSRSYTLICGWPYTLAKLHAREETYIIHVCIYLYQFKSCQSVCYFNLKSSSIRVMSLPS